MRRWCCRIDDSTLQHHFFIKYLSLALLIRGIFHLLCFLFLCGRICCSLSLTLFWKMLLRLELIYLFFLLFLGRILCFLGILLYIFEMFLICRLLWFFVLLCSSWKICRFLLLLCIQSFFFCICHYILWILYPLVICICNGFQKYIVSKKGEDFYVSSSFSIMGLLQQPLFSLKIFFALAS